MNALYLNNDFRGNNHWSRGGALDENGKGWLVNGGLKEQGVQNENFSGSQDLKIQWDCLLESLSYLIFSHY